MTKRPLGFIPNEKPVGFHLLRQLSWSKTEEPDWFISLYEQASETKQKVIHLISPIKFRPLDEGNPKSSGHKVMAKSNQEDLY